MTGFSDAQVRLLAGKLQEKYIRTREHHGVTLSYIEAWHAIDEANRVFGFEGWDRETLWAERIWEDGRREPKACSIAVRVRIRVRAGDTVVYRDGSGVGHGTGGTLGEAHESALKEAETDATKRALTTFGNLFGLALYDKAQNGVKRSPKPNGWGGMFTWLLVSAKGDLLGKYRNPHTFCAAMRDLFGTALVPEDLDTLWLRNGPAVEQLRTVCPDLQDLTRDSLRRHSGPPLPRAPEEAQGRRWARARNPGNRQVGADTRHAQTAQRRGTPEVRSVAPLSHLWPHAKPSSSSPLRAAALARQQGQRRVHRALMCAAPPRPP